MRSLIRLEGSRRSSRKDRRRRPSSSDSHVVSASMEELAAALEAVDPELPLEDVGHGLLPVFRRRRRYSPEFPQLLMLRRPPGVDVGVAIDIGPAFMHVGPEILERWAI